MLATQGEVQGETWHVSHLLKAKPASSLYDVPTGDLTPTAVLASRYDIDGCIRYLTTWAELEGHSWERDDDSGLGRTHSGRDLLRKFRRKFGRRPPATDGEDARLVEHPEWLEEVVA